MPAVRITDVQAAEISGIVFDGHNHVEDNRPRIRFEDGASVRFSRCGLAVGSRREDGNEAATADLIRLGVKTK